MKISFSIYDEGTCSIDVCGRLLVEVSRPHVVKRVHVAGVAVAAGEIDGNEHAGGIC